LAVVKTKKYQYHPATQIHKNWDRLMGVPNPIV